mgnify:CR=1 FL=1
MPRYFLTNNEHKKTTLTLHSEGQTAVSIEKNTAHSRNPLLDKLEIIAEAIGGLLEGKSSFSQSELRSLAPHTADDTHAQNKVRRTIATVSRMFTNVTSRRPPEERAPPTTFRKKNTYFSIVCLSTRKKTGARSEHLLRPMKYCQPYKSPFAGLFCYT